MSDIHWVKLSTAMFDDEKIRVIQSMPSGTEMCLIWIKLIVLAGKVNDNGCIYLTKDIPYTEDMFAKICGHPVEVIKLSLSTFQKLGMIDVMKDNTIALVNWEKHQNIEGLEKIRQLTRERVKRFREKQRLITGNVTVTRCNALDLDTDTDTDSEEEKIAPKRSTASAPSKPVINFDFTTELWENIADDQVDKWQDTYPATNVERELKKMAEWLLSNPKKRKKNYRRFITSWLERSQERGRG